MFVASINKIFDGDQDQYTSFTGFETYHSQNNKAVSKLANMYVKILQR